MIRSPSRGFSIVELVCCVVIAGVAVSAAAICWSPGQPGDALANARRSARQLKDATQIRGIGQALITWAQNNNDQYTLPSELDKHDQTVAEVGRAKDTSANIMSILIYNGFLPTEMLISPVETNPKIKPFDTFEAFEPKAAVKPANALWDPAFNADFTGEKDAGLSYAHLQPAGTRRDRWSNTFNAMEAIASMRGPEIAGLATAEDKSITPKFANEKSNTFGMFTKDKTAWSGNVGYNDNHVSFLADVLAPGKAIAFDPLGRNYADAEGVDRTDLMFYDEPDDAKSVNDYLGIFIKAGDAPADFKAIWD